MSNSLMVFINIESTNLATKSFSCFASLQSKFHSLRFGTVDNIMCCVSMIMLTTDWWSQTDACLNFVSRFCVTQLQRFVWSLTITAQAALGKFNVGVASDSAKSSSSVAWSLVKPGVYVRNALVKRRHKSPREPFWIYLKSTQSSSRIE